MSDSNNSSTYSTLSLDSESSEVASPLDSIFKSCLHALSPDSIDKKDAPRPGLFKILALMDKSSISNSEKRVTKDESISRLLDSLPVPVPSSSTAYSVQSEFPGSSEFLSDDLNPQKIGSSIFYDSSDKGDTLTPWHLPSGKFQGDQGSESELSGSIPPQQLLGGPMSGDCLSFDSKFKLCQDKDNIVLPKEEIVHEVYYSIAATNITVCDSENEIFQESTEQAPPESHNSSLNSDTEVLDEAEEGHEDPSGRSKESATATTNPVQVDYSSKGDSASNSNPSGSDKNNNESCSPENAMKLTASASPIEFNIPDFIDEDEMSSQDENIALCLRQLVGNNMSPMSGAPRSSALARKFSENFSNFFY